MARLTANQFSQIPESAEWPVATEEIMFDGNAVGQHVFLQPPEGERIHVGQVSTDYALMPNVEAMGVARQAIENAGFTTHEEWGRVFNGRKFQTTIVVSEGFEPIPGDRLNVGFRMTNSYDGSTKLRLDAMLFRVLCSNGMISHELFHGISLFHRGNDLKQYTEIASGLTAAYHAFEQVMPHIKEMSERRFNYNRFIPLFENVSDQFTGKAVHVLHDTTPKNEWEAFNNVTQILNQPKTFGDINTLDIFTTNALKAVA